MSIAIAHRGRRHDTSPAQDATRAGKTTSSWRYLPLAVLVTFGTVVAPIASVELFQELTGDGSILLSLLMAVGLSVAIATAGSARWQRRPGSTDILFGDLMLWGWVRRVRPERKLVKTTALLGEHSADRDRQVEILEQLARALDNRDPYTHGHSQRVARNAHMIATNLGLPAKQIAKGRVAAAVHDVGKLNTDRAILNKPGALTDAEYAAIKLHPGDGADMLASLGDPEIAAMVRHHHERLDGSGYPDGLMGDEIPIGARIIAVADTPSPPGQAKSSPGNGKAETGNPSNGPSEPVNHGSSGPDSGSGKPAASPNASLTPPTAKTTGGKPAG